MPPPKKVTASTNTAATKPDNDAPSSVKTYTVVNAINHDQLLYESGEQIDLDDESAAALLKVGAIVGDEDSATA